jgi:hypothetical protein
VRALEWCLPPFLRKRKALSEEDYLRHFARISPDDPAFNAICERGRDKVLDYLTVASDAQRPQEQRLIALDRGMTLARFLDDVDEERERAKAEIERQKEK